MIDLLLINPNEHAEEIVHALSAHKISFLIITTNGNMFAYPESVPVLNLNTDSWPKEEKFKSAIAWGRKGQQFLDGIVKLGQVTMSNLDVEDRINHFLVDKLTEELTTVYSFVSFNGQHAVIDAFVYKDGGWKVIKDHFLKFYNDRVNASIAFLDKMGIQQGPSKVYITRSGKEFLQMSFKTTKVSQRKFIEIWPLILTSDYPSVEFAAWLNETGKSHLDFYLANGL